MCWASGGGWRHHGRPRPPASPSCHGEGCFFSESRLCPECSQFGFETDGERAVVGWGLAPPSVESGGGLRGTELRDCWDVPSEPAQEKNRKRGGAPRDPVKGGCYFRDVLPLAAPSQGTRRFTTSGSGTRELRTGPSNYGPYQPRSFKKDFRFPFWFEYHVAFRSMAGDVREFTINAVGAFMPEELSVW